MPSNVSVAAQLISHLRTFREEAWDRDVRRRTELCLLDSLSCYSAGRSLKHYAPIASVTYRMFGMAPANTSARSSPSPFSTAYLYGSAANLLDYDDTVGSGHPGAAIVGGVLAVAAEKRLSTDRLLRGIAAGYQTEWLLGMAGAPSPERAALVRGVGAWDAVAAAAGIGVALGLDDALIEHCIGLAVAHSIIPYTAKWYERPVPSIKNNLGWVGAGAVLASELAVAGKTGVTNALEGDTGMWRMVGSDRWNLDPSLFEKPAVLRVGFKTFPVCWHLQGYLKTFAELLSTVAPDDEVVEIVLSGPLATEKFCEPAILSPTDTAFSLPAAFSLMLSGIEPGPQWVAYSDGDEVFRYRALFRFEASADRAVRIVTRSGAGCTLAVEAGSMLDMATEGLDEAGVLAKHQRLADTELRSGAAAALRDEGTTPDSAAPLYDALHQIIVNQFNTTADSAGS